MVPATSIPGVCGSVTGKGPGQVAAADAGVDSVEGGRRYVDPYLTCTRLGRLDVLDAEDVGVAELVEPDCLHG